MSRNAGVIPTPHVPAGDLVKRRRWRLSLMAVAAIAAWLVLLLAPARASACTVCSVTVETTHNPAIAAAWWAGFAAMSGGVLWRLRSRLRRYASHVVRVVGRIREGAPNALRIGVATSLVVSVLVAPLTGLAPLDIPYANAQTGVNHVVHISVDGVSSSMLQSLMAADPTNTNGWNRLVVEGSSTWNARTDYSHTITLPNHTSMLTARPVSQPSGLPNTTHHGWTSNSDPAPGDTLHNAGNPNLTYVVSAFDVAHDNGLSTSLFASKSKFSLFDTSYNAANGAPDTIGADNGTDKIDEYLYDSNTANMHASFLSSLASNNYNYSFVHYRDPDSSGHATGWPSPGYEDALRTVSGYLDDVLNTVATDPELAGNTVVIVTTDHGGGDPFTSHTVASSATNYTIPMFVWGADVAAGTDLYSLNTGVKTDPGTGRPTFTDANQPIRNGDTGTLALDLLGLAPIPGVLMNTPINVAGTGGNGVPVVTNPGAQVSIVGDGVALQVIATDADSDPLTFSATGLPPGLSISTSGLISGAPTVAGSYSVTVTADDGTDTGNAAFIWTVNDPAPPSDTLDIRVAAGTDDVEEVDGTGEMYTISTDLEMVNDADYQGHPGRDRHALQ